MFQLRPTSRQDFIHHLQAYHMDTCDVALVPKPSADGRSGDFDANDNVRAHSSLLTFLSPVFKEKLKAMSRSSEGNYIVSVDIDVSTQAIQAFVNYLYKKPIKAPFNQDVVSDALKLASFYQVPIFIFEELFSNKTVYLCLQEGLKRDKVEARDLLESCKETLSTNYAIFEDKSLFQDLNLDLIHWLSALDELPIPNLSNYVMDFALEKGKRNQEMREILTEARSDLDRCDRKQAPILKLDKSGNFQPPEKFSIRYNHKTFNDVLREASTFSCEILSPQHSRFYLQQIPEDNLEMTSHLADHNIKPGDTLFIEVKKQIIIRTIAGEEEKIFVDFNAIRIRDLKVQISDSLGTKDINKIVLMKNREILDDMQKLDDVFKEGDGDVKVLSATIRDSPLDAGQVVGYGEDNVAAWPGVVITADSSKKGREPARALSGSTSSWMSKAFSKGSVAQHWWQCKFGFPVVLGSFGINGSWFQGAFVTHHHVTDFNIKASLDEENWTTLISKEGIGEWNPEETKSFTCDNVKAFTFYRIASIRATDELPYVILSETCFSESLF